MGHPPPLWARREADWREYLRKTYRDPARLVHAAEIDCGGMNASVRWALEDRDITEDAWWDLQRALGDTQARNMPPVTPAE